MTNRSRSALNFALVAVLGLWIQTASAGLVVIGGVVTGNTGDTVSPTLFDDSVVDLEAADIRLLFDPAFLSFIGVTAGSLTSGFSIVAGAPTASGSVMEVLISMAAPVSGITGGPGSVLTASFLITNAASSGTTSVSFESLDAALYDLPLTSSQITVGDVNTVPIGNSGILSLSALVTLLGFWRRKSQHKS